MECKGICNLTIAGPGAGKTTQMIEIVNDCLSNLEPNRFLAVITYTNEATKEIKKRLQQKTRLPENVFIGTIHSFLIKFIFEPYAHIYGITTKDKIYVDEARPLYPIKDFHSRISHLRKNAEQLLDSGFVTYDKILDKSHQLIENDRICSIVANRLQYLFIDEYQDARLLQHKIILRILTQKKTNIYAIGDPMQYIFHFTYSQSQIRAEPKPESNDMLPIINLRNICQKREEFVFEKKFENYRCSPQIVSFLNKFNCFMEQQSTTIDNNHPIYFINGANLEEIVKYFKLLKEELNITKLVDNSIANLFLSSERDTFGTVAESLGLNEISNDTCGFESIYQETLRCILVIIGITIKQLESNYGIDEITFRKFVLKIIKKIKKDHYPKNNISNFKVEILELFREEFEIIIEPKKDSSGNINKSIEKLLLSNVAFEKSNHCYSTIHKAKGLQASSVLVIAERKSLLNQWLETDSKKIMKFSDDKARLGFVGFSRAIDFLCIGCLENVPTQLNIKMESLNVEVYPPPPGGRQLDLSHF